MSNQGDTQMIAHPYQHLRQCASTSSFHECISTAVDAENGVSRFRSKLEEALDYCHYRTIKPLGPTMKDTLAYWLVDWRPIIIMINWEGLLLDYDGDSSVAGRSTITIIVQK